MTARTHDEMVETSFAPRAGAYLTSSVHARGADLEALARGAEARRARGNPVSRVLDLGCGGGHVSFHVSPHVGEAVALDLSAAMVDEVLREASRRGLRNVRGVTGVAERLPFEDETFDLVVTRFSAHHWGDLQAGLHEVHRVLQRGGEAVFIDVVSPGRPLLDTHLQGIELFRDPSHVRDYSVAEWEAAVAAAGLTAGAPEMRRIPIAFDAWIARMNTPAPRAAVIRALLQQAPREVATHFAIEPDGSHQLDTMSLPARK